MTKTAKNIRHKAVGKCEASDVIVILLETSEPISQENSAYAIFSQLDLGEGDETLVSSANAKQGIKAILQNKI